LSKGRGGFPTPKVDPSPAISTTQPEDVSLEGGEAPSDSILERSLPETPPSGAFQDDVVLPGFPPAAKQQIEHLKKRLDEKTAQIAQVMDAYRNLKKDSERARQRLEQNQRRVFEKSKTDFISRFIDVLDNIDRAITAVENNFDSDSVLQGIILLRSRLVQLLRDEGLEKIFVEGQPFDPTQSEAAAVEPVDSEDEDNIVVRELQRGYTMNGALMRPARGVVGRFQRKRISKPVEATSPAADS
jgi:molecular chaperone GrpE